MTTRTRSSHDISPTYTGLSKKTERGLAIGVSGLAALAIFGLINNASSEGDAPRVDRIVQESVETCNQQTLKELGLQELEGSVVVNAKTNIRREPIRVEDEDSGETNKDDKFTEATKNNVVILKDPLVYTSPNGEYTWYGAKDPDTGEFYWVSASEVTLSKGVKVGMPDVNAESAIYISASRESGS